MLMIVGHRACTAVYDSLCLQREAVRDDNTCTVIDNDKHALRYMTVYDGICIHYNKYWTPILGTAQNMLGGGVDDYEQKGCPVFAKDWQGCEQIWPKRERGAYSLLDKSGSKLA